MADINELILRAREIRDETGIEANSATRVGQLLEDIAAAPLTTGPNDLPALWKQVRCFDTSTPQYEPGDATLAEYEQDLVKMATLCLNTTIMVDWGPDGYGQQYRVQFDTNGLLRVFKDGRFTGARDIPARLVLVGSEEEAAAGVDVYDPAELSVPADAIRLHLIGNLSRLFKAVVDLEAANFPGDVIPAPTGDLQADAGIWLERPTNVPPAAIYQRLSRAAFVSLRDDEQILPARQYLVQSSDAGDILVTGGFDGRTFFDAWRANVNGTYTPGTYDLDTDTFTEAATDGPGGAGLTPQTLVDTIDNVNGDVVSQVQGSKALLTLRFDSVFPENLESNLRAEIQQATQTNATQDNRLNTLENTVRPDPAIYAVNLSGAVYQGTSLAAAITHAGGYGKIKLNQRATLAANRILGAGTQFDCQFNELDLGGFTLTLSANCRLINCVGQNGKVKSNHGVDTETAPTIVGAYCGYTFELPGGTFMIADGVMVSDFGVGTQGTLWATGPGTLTTLGSFRVAAENTRQRDPATNIRPRGAGDTTTLQIHSQQGKRVATLAVTRRFAILSENLFDNATAIIYQLNLRQSGSFVAGSARTAAQVSADLAALSNAQLAAGVEIEYETIPVTANVDALVVIETT